MNRAIKVAAPQLHWATVGLALLVAGASAPGQLAITEVMADASTNGHGGFVQKQSDWWELTNYGTNEIDLEGYQFSDSDDVPVHLFTSGVPALSIAPGQSVVFVRTDQTTNEAQFRTWWGSCLAPEVPVRFYPRAPGINSTRDGLRLWNASGELVDHIDFGEARSGVSFVPDPNTGEFGRYAQRGVCGTCEAATTDDLGSPGTACGPIPLQFHLQPANQAVCAGGAVTLTSRATGLPRPRYQWFFDGLAIPGANGPDLTIANTLPASAGAYHVQVANGLTSALSSVAMLVVSTNSAPPTFLSPPSDAELYASQSATFSVSVCAYPLASYQWLSNGVPLAGATNHMLKVPDCGLAMSGAEFCVRVQNILGTNTACARLFVTPKPRLVITEVQARPNPDCFHHRDWFEITNFDTNDVNLLGYRFSDSLTFAGAFTNTNAVLVRPGGSVILAEELTAAEFTHWWGAANLPPGLPIITYAGFGLSDQGDQLYLWNGAAEDPLDFVASTAFEASTNFVTWRFEELECLAGCQSAVGEDGAFRAIQCGEIGSPGYVTNPPPAMAGITLTGSGATLITSRTVQGRTYRLEYNSVFMASGWNSLGDDFTATNSLMTRIDSLGGATQRFYRVVQISP